MLKYFVTSGKAESSSAIDIDCLEKLELLNRCFKCVKSVEVACDTFPKIEFHLKKYVTDG